MRNEDDYIELVKQARLGDEKSVNHLAELARERLRAYIYRLTLDEDLTQDILQESMLEMLKFLNKLEKADRFWPWLFRIASNNFRDHQDHERLRKTRSRSKKPDMDSTDKQQGLENLVGQELKQVVSAAMLALRPRHRKVLILRCYEEMTYSEISEVMTCTEFAARRLFYRAKKALAKQLSRRGLGRESLLVALVLFGKMTAASEAAAANVSVTATTVKVGVLATAGAVAAGSVAIAPMAEKIHFGPQESKAENFVDTPLLTKVGNGIEECRYYYPPNAKGAVMMWLISNTGGGQSYRQWLQQDEANYYKRNNTIYIENHRMWANDL
ncbi:MAG: RNA polymerase sigma factor, partial [Planctomycetota bacterium]